VIPVSDPISAIWSGDQIQLCPTCFGAARNDGYRIDTNAGAFAADQVIVATGAYQQPVVPAFAEQLDEDISQLHSSEYLRPDQVASGDVLIVGDAASSRSGWSTSS